MRGDFDEDELDDDGYPFDEEDNSDDDDYEGQDCGWSGRPGDGCGKAGSEECDFQCPHRNALYRELRQENQS